MKPKRKLHRLVMGHFKRFAFLIVKYDTGGKPIRGVSHSTKMMSYHLMFALNVAVCLLLGVDK